MVKRADNRTRRTWRRWGIGAAAALDILYPLIQSTVRETMPEGLLSRFQSPPAVHETDETPRDLDTLLEEARIPHVPPEAFEPLSYRTRDVDIGAQAGANLAHSLLAMREHLDTVGAVADSYGVPENLLYTIATIESLGGTHPIPAAYRHRANNIGPDVPAGLFHAKLTSLEEAVKAADRTRAAFEEHGLELPRGWPTAQQARAALPDDVYESVYEELVETPGEGFSREIFDRTILLAAQVPDGGIEDRMDAEQSARGAIVYLAQIDATLRAAGFDDVSLASLLAGYTGGHNGVRRAALKSTDDDIGRSVANDNGAWYTSEGEQVYALLERYASPDAALAAADALVEFRSRRPDATNEMLGELYVDAARDPEAFSRFDAYIIERRAEDQMRWIPISDIWQAYRTDATHASR